MIDLGELVVAGSKGAALREAIDQALDAIALPVGGAVEAGTAALVGVGLLLGRFVGTRGAILRALDGRDVR